VTDRRLKPWAAALLGYVIVTTIMTSPLFDYARVATASYEGDARAIIWALAWDNHVVLDRPGPLFDANIFFPAGNTLALNEHLFGISLFTLPIYAATRNPVLAYNVVWWFTFLANAMAARQLAWRVTREHWSAFTGGLVYAFSFFMMLHGHGHLNLIWVFWVPLSLLLFDKWIERPSWRDALLLAGCVILQVLSSWYVGAMLLLALLLRAAWSSAFETARIREHVSLRLAQGAILIVLAIAMISPFAAHYRHLDPVTPRAVRNLSADAAGYLVPPKNTWPGRLWERVIGNGPREMWGEQAVFAGWLAALLAILGAATTIRQRRIESVYFIALGVLAALLSFGPSAWASRHETWGNTAFGLFARLPSMALFRAPARFALLVVLAGAVLSAVFVASIRRRYGDRVLVVLPIAWAVMLSEAFVVGFPGGHPRPLPIPVVYSRLRSLEGGAVVSLPIYRNDTHWFREGDYMLYSTANWRPTVNGMARVEPADTRWVAGHMAAFPGVNSAKTMRKLGIRWVVLHSDRYADGAVQLIEESRHTQDFHLVSQEGTTYLFQVMPDRSGIGERRVGLVDVRGELISSR
jgi:hypothetical protein